MMNPVDATDHTGDFDEPVGLSLASLLALVWQRRWLFASVALLPLVLAVIYLHLASYKYRADLTLAPPQSSSSSGLSGQIGGSLGGIAALAGVGLGGQGGGLNYQLYRDSIYERSTAAVLAREPWIMHGIFPREWNARARQWHAPTGPLPAIKQSVLAALGAPDAGWQRPDAARLQDYLLKNVAVVATTKSPVVRLSFLDADPVFAARFLDRLHAVVDAGLRQRLLARTSANIAYLTVKLSQVQIAEHRQALAQELSDQEKLRMTASSTVAFAAEPMGSAASTPRPVRPDPAIVIAIALAAGLALGTLACLLPRRGRRANASTSLP